ncbi:MAG: AAA family ATPase [Proteobacteria bacterium]|nr:AAA family ATPase [Pseudomonadota bacterium]
MKLESCPENERSSGSEVVALQNPEHKPYKNTYEFLVELEKEILARMQLFTAKHQLRNGKRMDRSDKIAGQVRELTERRRQRISISRNTIPWSRLAEKWELDELEQDVLAYLLCYLEGIDIPQYAENHGRTKEEWVYVRRILSVLCESSEASLEGRQVFAFDGNLLKKGLVSMHALERDDSLAEAQVWLNAEVAAALMDDDNSLSHLRQGIKILRPTETFDHLVLPEETMALLRRTAARQDDFKHSFVELGLDNQITYGHGTVMLFEGPPGTGKTLAARAIAGESGKGLVVLKGGEAVKGSRMDSADMLQVALTEVQRCNGILLLDEFDLLLSDHGRYENHHDFLTQLEMVDAIVILATNCGRSLPEALDRRILHRVRFLPPDRPLRARIWDLHVPKDCPLSRKESDLLSRYPLTGGYIKNAVLQALHKTSLTFEEILAAAKTQSERMLSAMGEECDNRLVYYDQLNTATIDQSVIQSAVQAFNQLKDERTCAAREAIGDKGLRVWIQTEDVLRGYQVVLALSREFSMPCVMTGHSDLNPRGGDDEKGLTHLLNQWSEHVLVAIPVSSFSMGDFETEAMPHLAGWVREKGCFVFVIAAKPPENLAAWVRAFHLVLPLGEDKEKLGHKYLASLLDRAGIPYNPSDLEQANTFLPSHIQDLEAIFLDVVKQLGPPAIASCRAEALRRRTTEPGKRLDVDLIKELVEARNKLMKQENKPIFG